MLTRFIPVHLGAMALCLIGLVSGCTSKQSVTGNSTPTASIAASVNNINITQDDFIASLVSYVPNQQNGTLGVPAGRVVMAQLIQDAMVEGLAAQEHVPATQQEIDDRYSDMKLLHDAQTVKTMETDVSETGLTVDQFKRLKLAPAVAQSNLLSQGTTISDADIDAFYNSNKTQRFTKSDRAHIKRIAFATQAQAQAVYNQISTGGKMFETFIDQSAVKNPPDADLPNWIPTDPTKSPKLAPLCKAILATQVGETSKPFLFQGGWWLVKVIAREPAEQLQEPVVHHLIQWILLDQRQNQDRMSQVQQALRAYESQAKVTITDPTYSSIVDNIKAVASSPQQPGGPTPQ